MTQDGTSQQDKLHGRRVGRKLRLGQQRRIEDDLPRYQITVDAGRDPTALFPGRKIWLEVGFGGGEHLATQAAAHPEVGIIGCEVFQTGIVGLLNQIVEQRLGNVRILVDDARLLLAVLPDRSIDRVFVLFPDPWPKTRQQKRRFFSPTTMDQLARILPDGAELRVATDDPSYQRAMLALVCAHPAFEWTARRPSDWLKRPDDWPQTRYEQKAIAAGRRPAFLRMVRRPR